MANTYSKIYVQLVFAVRGREDITDEERRVIGLKGFAGRTAKARSEGR